MLEHPTIILCTYIYKKQYEVQVCNIGMDQFNCLKMVVIIQAVITVARFCV